MKDLEGSIGQKKEEKERDRYKEVHVCKYMYFQGGQPAVS